MEEQQPRPCSAKLAPRAGARHGELAWACCVLLRLAVSCGVPAGACCLLLAECCQHPARCCLPAARCCPSLVKSTSSLGKPSLNPNIFFSVSVMMLSPPSS
ncbi:hypothetical protein P8452_65500 [Trifolium repens]|nr:hypothetical protein P8452_65500 [Trifolium repens]